MNIIKILLFILFTSTTICGQTINSSVPKKIDKTGRYIFYLHGRIIEEQGINAAHPTFGEYRYLDILDSLKTHNFNVISEARQKNTDDILYAEKVFKQIDTLINAGVDPDKIFVFGASKGAYITLWISSKALNKNLNFIVMGACSDETINKLSGHKICGNFLSIFEASDNFAASCVSLLKEQKCISDFQEIRLTLNNKHGFLYKPYSEWMTPLINWTNKID
ncbi:alpha/beta hydrolase family protein [Sporocytophaga myxococcoides]|uniref:alpha/beta hydrolase family protein n=1 Tax=Sporocytophaga myxococcoides TaxID=153721 RepID=UPI000426FD75|nr:hypothetical protein [Sporocytophaga myxococcoides]